MLYTKHLKFERERESVCVCVKQNESVRGWSILREAETDTDRETGRVWDRGEQRERKEI